MFHVSEHHTVVVEVLTNLFDLSKGMEWHRAVLGFHRGTKAVSVKNRYAGHCPDQKRPLCNFQFRPNSSILEHDLFDSV